MGKTTAVTLQPVDGDPLDEHPRAGRPRKYDFDSMERGKWHSLSQVNGLPTWEAVHAAAWRYARERKLFFRVHKGGYGRLLVRFDQSREAYEVAEGKRLDRESFKLAAKTNK